MTTQDSTDGITGTDQYESEAPEDAGHRDEHGERRSYTDQHSTDGREEVHGRGSGDVPVTDAADRSSGGVASTLIPADRAGEFKGRWTEMKADFVDEPRDTVRKIDGLVGEVLDELNEVFKRQRSELEHDLKNDNASTEDLRVAFRRYREFFDRLLSV